MNKSLFLLGIIIFLFFSNKLSSSVPTFHGQLQFKRKNSIAGIGAEYQSLKPVIESGGLASHEKVNSETFFGYFRYADEKFIAKIYGITGENLHHLVMIGGFAGYENANGIESYKPTKTSAFWLDLASANAKIAPELFLGYTKNYGIDADFKNLYIRGLSGKRILDDVLRASARVDFKQNKLSITPEIEYTKANGAI